MYLCSSMQPSDVLRALHRSECLGPLVFSRLTLSPSCKRLSTRRQEVNVCLGGEACCVWCVSGWVTGLLVAVALVQVC
jgi:hypothetical protein